MLNLLEKNNFDLNLMPSDRPLVLNLKKEDLKGNFRMNERIFKYELSAYAGKNK